MLLTRCLCSYLGCLLCLLVFILLGLSWTLYLYQRDTCSLFLVLSRFIYFLIFKQGNHTYQTLALFQWCLWTVTLSICCGVKSILPQVSLFSVDSLLASHLPSELWANMSSSTELEVHNISEHHQRVRTEPRVTCTENCFCKILTWFSRYASGETGRHVFHNMPLPYWGHNK